MHVNGRIKVLFLLSMGLALFSCEDVIDVDLEEAPDQLVVDAWLNNKSELQTITLSSSQNYFDNQFASGIEGAVVSVERGGVVLNFEDQGKGVYTWTPAAGETIGEVGDNFNLAISLDASLDNIYFASSTMNRVPIIDSIVYEFRTDELIGPDGIYAEFFARDIPGRGDTYWIKTFKNGEFLNKPAEMNITFDAGFDAGADTDGLVFLRPIRELVNRVPDVDNPEDDGEIPPYIEGDSIFVEIHSLTNEAFTFLEIARDQMNNGANTIFAIPIANTRGNVINTQTEEFALGIFCVSAVESMGQRIE